MVDEDYRELVFGNFKLKVYEFLLPQSDEGSMWDSSAEEDDIDTERNEDDILIYDDDEEYNYEEETHEAATAEQWMELAATMRIVAQGRVSLPLATHFRLLDELRVRAESGYTEAVAVAELEAHLRLFSHQLSRCRLFFTGWLRRRACGAPSRREEQLMGQASLFFAIAIIAEWLART